MRCRRLGFAGLALLLACGFGTPNPAQRSETGITGAQFAQVFTELRRAARDNREDAAAFEAAKDEILERHGITADQLLEFAATHGGDIPAMARIWDTIDIHLTRPDSIM